MLSFQNGAREHKIRHSSQLVWSRAAQLLAVRGRRSLILRAPFYTHKSPVQTAQLNNNTLCGSQRELSAIKTHLSAPECDTQSANCWEKAATTTITPYRHLSALSLGYGECERGGEIHLWVPIIALSCWSISVISIAPTTRREIHSHSDAGQRNFCICFLVFVRAHGAACKKPLRL